MIPFYKKVQLLLFFLALLVLTGCAPGGLAKNTNPPDPDYYTYSIQYFLKNGEVRASLDKFDIRTDQVVEQKEIDAGFNDISLEPDGNLILTKHRPDMRYSNQVSRYYAGTKSVRHLFNTRGYGITRTFPVNNKLFITTYIAKKNKTESGIDIFSENPPKYIKSLYFGDEEEVYTSIELSQDKNKIVAGSEAIRSLSTEGEAKVFIINTNQNTISKIINFSSRFDYGYIQAIENCSNKIYIAATCTKIGQSKVMNNKLLVFSEDKFKLIKKIPIGIVADSLTYVKSLNRLYVGHGSWGDEAPPWIEVIDCKTDKVIGKIAGIEGVRVIQHVGNYKLYVTVSGGKTGFGTGEDPGILVVDLKTDKIIKKIPGNYAPIAYNPDPVDDLVK